MYQRDPLSPTTQGGSNACLLLSTTLHHGKRSPENLVGEGFPPGSCEGNRASRLAERVRGHHGDDNKGAGPYTELRFTAGRPKESAVLDIKWIRDHPDAFVKGLTDRGFDDPGATLNRILSLDEQRRTTIQQLQEAQARRNAASKEIGQAKQAKDETRAEALKEEVARLKTAIQDGEAAEREVNRLWHLLLAHIPNIPAADVPVGPDADSNKVLREVGTPTKFSFQPKQHFELGEALGLMDFETAAKLSGARFVVLKGALARLERALGQFMLDLHTSEHGYTEVNPPILVRRSSSQ